MIKITKDTTISTDTTDSNTDTIDINDTTDTNTTDINACTREQFAITKTIVEGSDSKEGEILYQDYETPEDENSNVSEEEQMKSSDDNKRKPTKLSLKPKKSTSNKIARTSLTSLFVGSLSRKKMGNRLGQRARQKLEDVLQ